MRKLLLLLAVLVVASASLLTASRARTATPTLSTCTCSTTIFGTQGNPLPGVKFFVKVHSSVVSGQLVQPASFNVSTDAAGIARIKIVQGAKVTISSEHPAFATPVTRTWPATSTCSLTTLFDVPLPAAVFGPGTVTDNTIPRWDGTTGALLQSSTGVISDDGALSGVTIAGSLITSGTVAAARLGLMTGDTGAGGASGAVPTPAAGDAAASKFLKADGTWQVVSTGSFVDLTTNQAVAGNKTLTGITTLGTGTHTGGSIFTPVSTPEFVSIASGTSATPSTNVAPAMTVSKIWNGAAAGGVGLVATFYGTHAGGAGAAEMVDIWARQTTAGSISGMYVRAVGAIAGAGQSHFAAAFSMEQDITNVDRSVAEFNINNQTGFDAGGDYGTAGNRANGIGIVAVGDKKSTVAVYIDTHGGTVGNFFTGIDFRPGSVDATTQRAIRIPSQTSLVSWAVGNSNDIPLIQGSTDGVNDTVRVSPAGRSIVLGNGFLGTTGTTGFLYMMGMAGAPSGVPVAITGEVPMVYDTVNDSLKVYNGGSWKNVGTGGSGNLTVGTTSITSGTTTRVLFDNAGALGEYSISGTGNVAMTAAPSFTSGMTLTQAQDGITSLTISNTSTGVTAVAAILLTNNAGANAGFFGLAGSNYTPVPILLGRLFFDANPTTQGIAINTESAQPIVFGVSSAERGRFSILGVFNSFKGGNVLSAATIAITGNTFHVTGTTNITSVSGTSVEAGTVITIIFDDALTFTDGSNLKLAGNFVTTADDTITLVYDGSNWYEKSRSVN